MVCDSVRLKVQSNAEEFASGMNRTVGSLFTLN
ncbi:hypothetical protein Glaag_1215 [Glaciecola sp. 4H-3-7+YE-5]|nr:hypothetical protein Glaag_1215 [Glaciecola sp. 4H-3-7+YE-5]